MHDVNPTSDTESVSEYLRSHILCVRTFFRAKVDGFAPRALDNNFRIDCQPFQCKPSVAEKRAREFFIDNLLVRIHSIIVMIRWAGLAPWEPEFSFPGSLTSTYLEKCEVVKELCRQVNFRKPPVEC